MQNLRGVGVGWISYFLNVSNFKNFTLLRASARLWTPALSSGRRGFVGESLGAAETHVWEEGQKIQQSLLVSYIHPTNTDSSMK